jgi:hypothetical protein
MKQLIIDWSFDPWIAFIPIILLCLGYVFYVWRFSNDTRFAKLFWPVSLIFLFLVRSQDFFLQSMNPDEDQWIIAANSLVHDPNLYFHYFIIADFSRFLTILPLAIIGVFKSYIGYDQARLTNLILLALFAFYQRKIISRYFGQSIGNYTTALLFLIFGLASTADYIAYNSEMPTILILMVSLYLYVEAIHTNKSIYFLAAAFFAGIAPFAKEQALPMAAVFLVFYFSHQLSRKNYKNVATVAAGFVIVLVGFVTIIYVLDASELMKIHISNIQTYSSQGLGTTKSSGFYSSLTRSLKLSIWNVTNFTIAALALAGMISVVTRFTKMTREFKALHLFFLLLSVSAFYITFLPGNYFFHYSIFYYLFSFWFAAQFFALPEFQKWNRHIFAGAGVLAIIISAGGSHRLFYPISEITAANYIDKDDAIRSIEKLTNPGDRIMVWGWENSYYIKTQTQRSSYYLYPQFVTDIYPMKAESIQIYLNELELLKPVVIVETVGEGRFFFEDKSQHSIEVIDMSLMDYINEHYSLTETGDNYRVFVRKN